MCTMHGCSSLLFHLHCLQIRPIKESSAKTRNYLIGRGPLMCPWAFATQSESHRRPHTDNRAARHGFWKVTLRIAKNGSGPIRGARPNVHTGKWTGEHAWIQRFRQRPAHSHTQQRRAHRERARARPSNYLVWLEQRMAHCWGNDCRGGARWLHLLMLERKKLFAHQAMFN